MINNINHVNCNNEIKSILPNYYNHKIAVVGRTKCFIDYRNALVDSIKEYGFEAYAYEKMEEALSISPTCVVVINPLQYPVPENNSIIWIMIQTEQLFTDDSNFEQPFLKKHINELMPHLGHYDIVLDICMVNIKGLRKITESDVRFFPYGAYPAIDNYQDTKENEKKYDVLFIGEMPGVNNRRKDLLNFLSSRYKVYPKTSLWYEEKTKAIANSKICLNIHFDESRYFEVMRIYDFCLNKGFVMSEPMYHTEPFEEGEDFVEFFWTDLCDKIDYYLSHDDERNRIAENGYRKAHNQSLLDSTKILIDALLLESYKRILINKEEQLRINRKFSVRVKRLLKRVLNKLKRLFLWKRK